MSHMNFFRQNYYGTGNGDNNDILQDIQDEELPVLRDLFAVKWPYASQAYMFIDNIITWKKKIPNLRVKFTCPDGKWRDGTFVAIINEWNYKIYYYTLDMSSERLMTALRTTNRIDWTKGPYIIDTHEKLIAVTMNMLPALKQPVEYLLESTCWWLPKDKALSFEINVPSELQISPLKREHAIFINSNWPQVHTFPGSEKFLAKIIETNGGLGLFTTHTDEIRSWLLVNDFGALSVLQTVEKYKRNGYASMLIKELSKTRAKNSSDSIACIIQDNIISKALFTSLGFVKLHDLRCIQFKRSI